MNLTNDKTKNKKEQFAAEAATVVAFISNSIYLNNLQKVNNEKMKKKNLNQYYKNF